MLRQEEWLSQAKRLAVGMTMRVFHGRERRPNMTVGNERGRWWAYCNRCKEGGVLQKDHVMLAPLAVDDAERLELPSDLRVVLGSDYELPVARFLASKGMDMRMLPKLWYSECTRRLCLQDPWGSGWHGRDMSERSAAKWLHYSKPKLAGKVARMTIVTEDLFSMFKVEYTISHCTGDWARFFQNVGVASTLGAGCSTGAALALKNCTSLVWAYDGDKAGDDGYVQASKRMRVHVPKQYRFRPPEGLDPKDMDCEAIRELIKEVFK